MESGRHMTVARYHIGDASPERLLASVAERFEVRFEPAVKRRTIHYDTVDWRVFRAGGTLWSVDEDDFTLLFLQQGDRLLVSRIDEPPDFVWNMTAEAIHDVIAPAVKMRRLLPIVSVEAERDVLDILDSRQKTVARVAHERSTAIAGGTGSSTRLPGLLMVESVKGYDQEYLRVVDFLEEELGLSERAPDEREVATAAIGRRPGDYTSKLEVHLDPSMRADEAMKSIHGQLLATIQRTEDGVIEDIDTEYLHNFRIAVRKTRAALTQVKGVYPETVVDRFRPEFAWLGDITGPTRDLDVYQLTMPSYRIRLPESARADLDPLESFLASHQRIAQQELATQLAGERYHNLLREWARFLKEPVPQNTSPAAAERPILGVASKRIWKAYRRVIKMGRAIGRDAEPEALHELRIECKKLRYLLEFFRSLYDPDDVTRLIDELKRLQDNLGDFNDLEIQQAKLKEFGNTMLEEGDAPFATYMAMGRLVEVFEELQEDERHAFHSRFDRFASTENKSRFRCLFGPAKSKQA
jgi:CHAD domain-containing protein